MNKKIYLAGPFFNLEQVSLMEYIEECLDDEGVTYFAPRKESPVVGELTAERASEILKANLKGIAEADVVLAVLDWKTTKNNKVYSETTEPTKEGHLRIYKQLLNIPDSGTVWEAGYAKALKKPVYVFYEDRPEKINLMISQTASGIIIGSGQLCSAFEMHKGQLVIDARFTQTWDGGVY